ncbi:MAG: ELM1/GtrOC1 family putative glycosyltransferase [Verrucomicrobiota bacterium]
MHLSILSDGKLGHENQSLGLAEALAEEIDLTYQIHRPKSKIPRVEQPSAIIAAGHKTHLRLLTQSRRFKCPSILIMKPSLPTTLFTRCLAPEHDYLDANTTPPNVILTKGALNRIPSQLPKKKTQGLIMLGGYSKHFHWKLERILQAIITIVSANPHLKWLVADSRRTPPATLTAIADLDLSLQTISHETAPNNWLRDTLLESQIAWVTPDSTSMVFEALTAGCRLGTLPLKRLDTKMARFHEQMATENWFSRFADQEQPGTAPILPPLRLHETSRCAKLLLPLLQP